MSYAKSLLPAALVLLSLSAVASERLIIVNEGLWQSNNGRLSYFVDGSIVSNDWFSEVNGYKLGDTPNDIVQISDDLLAITVNTSNIVQFISADGKAVGATEDVPNNRCLATDGTYVYVSSYGHECQTVNGLEEFEKGFVAKIDATTHQAVAAVEVGYEPEGIAYYDGYLFVANSGGYAFQEDHDYESTVSIIDAETMQKVREIDTGIVNLMGMTRSGQYLCISSPGDYYDVPATTVILDCAAALSASGYDNCFATIESPATYSTVALDGSFYTAGSAYSYLSSSYEFGYMTIDPAKFIQSNGTAGYTASLPGTVGSDIAQMDNPYCIYVNPYSGYIYATDAAGYVEGGKLYQWDPSGKLLGKNSVYLNPGTIIALSDGAGVEDIAADKADAPATIYNLQGIPVANPIAGQLYIQKGKKFIQH